MTSGVRVEPGTIAVYGDIACPWAHIAVYRLLQARSRLGLAQDVQLDLRAFPLELVNERPTPKRVLDAEIPVAGALEPSAGWQMWQAEPWEWPVTSLLALEAVEAAKAQGLEPAAQLGRDLRLAMFAHSRCISLRHVVLDVASSVTGLDAGALEQALDQGAGRREVLAWLEDHRIGPVKGSPHLFLSDGSDFPNPGIEMRWEGEHGIGFPVVDRDNPAVYDDILTRAGQTRAQPANL